MVSQSGHEICLCSVLLRRKYNIAEKEKNVLPFIAKKIITRGQHPYFWGEGNGYPKGMNKDTAIEPRNPVSLLLFCFVSLQIQLEKQLRILVAHYLGQYIVYT